MEGNNQYNLDAQLERRILNVQKLIDLNLFLNIYEYFCKDLIIYLSYQKKCYLILQLINALIFNISNINNNLINF